MSIYKNGKLVAGGSQALPLLCFMWSDHRLNHPSWLNSTTFSWQSGAVYQAAYAHLVLDIDGKTLQSETIGGTTIQFYLADDGHKICPASEESNVMAIYNATDVAWYYIIDTFNQKFKLPRSSHNKYTSSLSVVGNGRGLSLTNGSRTFGIQNDVDASFGAWGKSSQNVGAAIGSSANRDTGTYSNIFGVSQDPTLSGLTTTTIAQDTDQYKYLYFYVGNFTQTALENTAGITTEEMNNKVNIGHEVIEFQAPTATNNYTWYRKYADGWVEQGGLNTQGAVNRRSAILPIEMADGNYTVMFVPKKAGQSGSGSAVGAILGTTTTTGFQFVLRFGTGGLAGEDVLWQANGMAA